jgi:hypothetical protein
MRHVTTFILIGAALLVGSRDASAQWWGRPPIPASGVCFYEDIYFGGRYFCVRSGDSRSSVPGGTNDRISSLRVYGDAEVTIYKDTGFRGPARRFASNISDLRRSGFNDLVSSFRVASRSRSGGTWGGAYGGGSWGSHEYDRYDDGYNGGYGGAYGGGSHSGSSHSGWNKSQDNRMTYQEAEDIVRRAYRNVLQRDPDPAARSWVNEVMKQNMSQRQLEAELRNSQEYRNKHKR